MNSHMAPFSLHRVAVAHSRSHEGMAWRLPLRYTHRAAKPQQEAYVWLSESMESSVPRMAGDT